MQRLNEIESPTSEVEKLIERFANDLLGFVSLPHYWNEIKEFVGNTDRPSRERVGDLWLELIAAGLVDSVALHISTLDGLFMDLRLRRVFSEREHLKDLSPRGFLKVTGEVIGFMPRLSLFESKLMQVKRLGGLETIILLNDFIDRRLKKDLYLFVDRLDQFESEIPNLSTFMFIFDALVFDVLKGVLLANPNISRTKFKLIVPQDRAQFLNGINKDWLRSSFFSIHWDYKQSIRLLLARMYANEPVLNLVQDPNDYENYRRTLFEKEDEELREMFYKIFPKFDVVIDGTVFELYDALDRILSNGRGFITPRVVVSFCNGLKRHELNRVSDDDGTAECPLFSMLAVKQSLLEASLASAEYTFSHADVQAHAQVLRRHDSSLTPEQINKLFDSNGLNPEDAIQRLWSIGYLAADQTHPGKDGKDIEYRVPLLFRSNQLKGILEL